MNNAQPLGNVNGNCYTTNGSTITVTEQGMLEFIGVFRVEYTTTTEEPVDLMTITTITVTVDGKTDGSSHRMCMNIPAGTCSNTAFLTILGAQCVSEGSIVRVNATLVANESYSYEITGTMKLSLCQQGCST